MKTIIYENDKQTLFPLYPVTISPNHLQEKVIRPNGTAFNQIFVVREGSGVLKLPKKTYMLQKNDMFFIPENMPHKYNGAEDFTTCFMGFCGGENLFKYFNITDGFLIKGQTSVQLLKEFKDLYNIFQNADIPIICSRAFSLVAMFFTEALEPERTPIEKVLYFISENFSKPLALDDILCVYPYSKAKLCRDFRNEYKVTIFEKLNEIRLEHSLFMLKNNPELPIKDIAEKCGYNDESYFCRMFKSRFGVNANSIRKHKKGM